MHSTYSDTKNVTIAIERRDAGGNGVDINNDDDDDDDDDEHYYKDSDSRDSICKIVCLLKAGMPLTPHAIFVMTVSLCCIGQSFVSALSYFLCDAIAIILPIDIKSANAEKECNKNRRGTKMHLNG